MDRPVRLSPAPRRKPLVSRGPVRTLHAPRFLGLVPSLNVPRQAVPNAADAGNQLPTMTDRPKREAEREDEGLSNAAEHPAWSIRPALIQPKIKYIAGKKITSQRPHVD